MNFPCKDFKAWILLTWVLLAGSGCRSTYNGTLKSKHHPAHVDAEMGQIPNASEIFEKPPSTLVAANIPQSPEDHGMHAGSIQDHSMHGALVIDALEEDGLPPAAIELLDRIAEAKLHIAGAIHTAPLATVQALIVDVMVSLEKLESVEVPGNPHVWHKHAEHMVNIRQVAGKLKAMQDLRHGHHLSTELTQAVDILFASLNYDRTETEGDRHGKGEVFNER